MTDQNSRHAPVTAVLGPTNTGKTHLAIERMLGHSDGVIGLPLRLLAREVYGRIADRVGSDAVALVTGEERIIPDKARYRVCTVEALPEKVDAAFVAIDEIQLAADLERGHVFTDRMLHLRGREETLLLGAATMRGMVEALLPGVNVVTRPRMSTLVYAGSRKITRLPPRSAVVAFSANEVYAIAELIRRQRGGAAVVLGALSPRTRNAQVEIFQSGDVGFLVATDAIGMGLNLDVDHVAFAADRKFDGYQNRRLTPSEFGQVAGRAGRHMRDGSFGVTSRVEPFDDELVEALESHRFDPVKTIQWRNRVLDYASLKALVASLERLPTVRGLAKAPPADDLTGLTTLARDDRIAGLADSPDRVRLLWDVCQVPDYRKIAPANHADMVASLFTYLAGDGVIPDDWFAEQLAHADRTDGDIDTLSHRIAHVRTWTFVANRERWLRDPGHWQERTRAIEDRLSDALHERLTARFIDRRTSVLMRRLKENVMLEAEITEGGDVMVEGQHVGNLDGLRFVPDPNAAGPEAKALRTAAQKALAGEMVTRADRIAGAPDTDFALSVDGALRWKGTVIARLIEGEDALKPRLALLADDGLAEAARDRAAARLDLWLETHVGSLLKPLFDLRQAEGLTPAARGIAFRLAENFGVLERSEIAEEVRALEQEARAGMRALGVRFGAYHIYVPALLKPAPGGLIAMLWALKNGGLDAHGLQDLAHLAASGRTSVPADAEIAPGLYRAGGYKVCGMQAVRLDILERLADLIRPLLAWRPTGEDATPPEGALAEYGFTVTVAMTSLLGCAGDEFASVLKAIGYESRRRPAPQKPGQDAPATVGETAEPDGDAAASMPTEDPQAEAGASEDTPADAQTGDADAATETPETGGPEAVDAAGDSEPAPDAAASTVTSAPEADEAATDSAPAEAAAEATDEPAFIEVWRPARPDRPRQGQRRGKPRETRGEQDGAQRGKRRPKRAEGGRPGGKGRRPSGKPSTPRTDRQKQPARRDPDPNSPFAALANLKAELEAQERDG